MDTLTTIVTILFISIVFIINIKLRSDNIKLKKKLGEDNDESIILNKMINTIKNSSGLDTHYLTKLPLPAWCKSINGRMLWINQEYERLFDVKNEDYVGKLDIEIWGKEISDKFKENDSISFESNKPFKTTEIFPDKDGEMHEWNVIKFPIRDGMGNTIAIGGICFRANLTN